MNSKGVKVLVYESSPEKKSVWLRSLLSAGFIPQLSETQESLIKDISSRKYSIICVSLTAENIQILQALKRFREVEEFRYIHMILCLENAEKKWVVELIKQGFYNLITQEQVESLLLEKLSPLAEPSFSEPDRRQHIRITLPEYENAKAVIMLPNGRKIIGMIRNISMGGIHITFRERVFIRLNRGDVLRNCLLVIKDTDLHLDLEVILLKDKSMQLQFPQLSESYTNLLARLIYDYLQFGF